MAEEQPRKREGLEGIPINTYEVWGFDAVRTAAQNPNDGCAFGLCWLVVAGTIALAVWGRSVILGGLGVVGLVLITTWTQRKWQRRALARRIRRREADRARADERADGGQSPPDRPET